MTMIGLSDPDARPSHTLSRLTALRWTAAAAMVIAVHGAGVWAALRWHPSESASDAAPPAVEFDLAPLAVAPPAPPQDVAPGPQQTEAEPEPTPDTPTPIEDAKPDPTPPDPVQVAEDVKPDTVPPAPAPTEKIPDLPKKDEAEAVLSPPLPKPKVQKKPTPKVHEVERNKPVRLDKKRIRETTAPPSTEARHADLAAAPSAGSSFAPSISPATWKSELMAHLNRYKRYPSGAAGYGTASIAFTISRSGQVLSARLIGSSGDHALDAEAVSLPQRATPLPAPPPNIGGGVITLTVPIRFGG